MRKIILIVHISLDGFVAGVNGELDGFDASEENLQFVCSLTKDADTALFGRLSYELVNSAWPTAGKKPNATKGEIAYSNWYNSARKIVISGTLLNKNSANTTIISEDVLNEIVKLKKEQGRDILIFGSPKLSQLLMKNALIHDYWIFINPVVFGKGIPLFTESKHKIDLKLLSVKQFSNGETALHYRTNNMKSSV